MHRRALSPACRCTNEPSAAATLPKVNWDAVHPTAPNLLTLNLCVKDRLTLLKTGCLKRAVSECTASLGAVAIPVALIEARPRGFGG